MNDREKVVRISDVIAEYNLNYIDYSVAIKRIKEILE